MPNMYSHIWEVACWTERNKKDTGRLTVEQITGGRLLYKPRKPTLCTCVCVCVFLRASQGRPGGLHFSPG